MPARKRAAEAEPDAEETSPRRSSRATKARLTDDSNTTADKPKGKRGPKTKVGANDFKASALPLHVNITHTPPAIPDDDQANATSADPGFVGTTALLPSSFNTGSYGWKGNKRVTIEIVNNETGEKEKVHVMVTINATVMGSKNAKNGDAAETEDVQDELEENQVAADAVAEESKTGKAAE